MALTNSQKEALDVVVSALVKTLIEEETEFTYKELLEEICNEVSFHFTVQSLVASVKRVLPANATIRRNSSNNYKILSYSFVMGSTFTKNHNLVTFNNNGGSEITYDFIEKTFNCNIESERIFDKGLLLDLIEVNAFDYEWMWNYTSNVYSIIAILNSKYADDDKLKIQPKGLHQFLINHNYPLRLSYLEDFYRKNTYSNFDYNFTIEVLNGSFETMDKLLETMGSTDIIKKIMIATIKNGEIPGICDMRDLIVDIIKYKIFDVLDGNRTLSYNIKLYHTVLENRKNEILQRQLQKLNFINSLEFDDYIVVVPQTIEEKADEGKQQNNCVGYYYDDSIIKGENLIYFLRKKNKPNKSYMTCRYNIPTASTIEHRYKNNKNVCNETEIEILKKIDKIIKEKLN